MTSGALEKFRKDFQQNIKTYFGNDSSDAEAVIQIFTNSYNFYRIYKETDEFEEEPMHSDHDVIDLEDEGLHLAQDFSSVFHSGMLESFDPVDRIRLMESCIYALNARLNIHISEYKRHRYGKDGNS